MQLMFGDAEGLGKRKRTRREIFLVGWNRWSRQGLTVQTGDLRSISTGTTTMVRDRHMLIRGLMEFAGQVCQLATGQEAADA